MLKVCVVGATGRMGVRLLRQLHAHPETQVSSVLIHTSTPADLPDDVLVSADPAQAFAAADIIIDFSAPACCLDLMPIAAESGCAYVLASTGLEAEDESAIERACEKIPVIIAANFSVGVNMLLGLVKQAAQGLGEDFDTEIMEIHHRHKRDAPSGTALALGAAVEAGRGEMNSVMGRAGHEPERSNDQLGYAAIRGGDVSGEHTVYFMAQGERIELTHRASTPDIFADGAIKAALWLRNQKPGRYGMADVLAGA